MELRRLAAAAPPRTRASTPARSHTQHALLGFAREPTLRESRHTRWEQLDASQISKPRNIHGRGKKREHHAHSRRVDAHPHHACRDRGGR
eukprot:2704955-Rhodomonas_salina.2